MTSDSMKMMFAAQLDSLNLDRTGTIEAAAAMIADLTTKLAEADNCCDRLDTVLGDAIHLAEIMHKSSELCDEYSSSDYASRNAEKMLANDKNGKQAAKRAIRTKWDEWHESNPHYYSDNTDFAEAMINEYSGTLESVVQITQWCGEWSKEAVFRQWEKWKATPRSTMTNEEFAASMKQRIKTLKPHIIIGWCEQFERSSNPAS